MPRTQLFCAGPEIRALEAERSIAIGRASPPVLRIATEMRAKCNARRKKWLSVNADSVSTTEALVESFDDIGDGVQGVAFELIANIQVGGRMLAGIAGGQPA